MNIKRIVLSGTGFYGYLDSIALAFERSGVRTIRIPYRNVRNGLHSLPGRIGIGLYAKALHRRVLRQVIDAGQNCDVIILFRGDFFLPEDLDLMREKCQVPVVVWTIDSVHEMLNGLELCGRADMVFLYNRDEAGVVAPLGTPTSFSPLAFDQRLYFPVPTIPKDIDIYFVGSFPSNRKAILNEMIEMLEVDDYSIVIDGSIVPFWRPGFRKEFTNKYPYLFRHATNRTASHQMINTMTNRARICLNILPIQATSGLNTRAFEICGGGGFQLVNRNVVLDSLFKEGAEVEAYSSTGELVDKIRYYLQASHRVEREAIAAGGLRRAQEWHTFDERVCFVKETVERFASQ